MGVFGVVTARKNYVSLSDLREDCFKASSRRMIKIAIDCSLIPLAKAVSQKYIGHHSQFNFIPIQSFTFVGQRFAPKSGD